MRVTLYLAERRAQGADIPVEPVVVNTLKGRHREPEHLARNAFGTLPVLELDSGAYVTESLVDHRLLRSGVSHGMLITVGSRVVSLRPQY